MNLTPIRDLVKKTRHLDPKKLGNDSFTYVDISSVDKDTKRITEPQTLLVGDAPSRARKEIKVNDVLVATVRPNLNGVAIVPPEYDNQIASTGFCVLRVDPEQLDPNYLLYFTQTETFISHLTELSTGAGYPAVSDEDILETRIPLPPLTEQKRIASLLARADRLRQLRRTAHDLGDALLQSVFLEMFGKYLNKIECQFGDVLEIPLTNGFFEKNEKYGEGNPIVWVDDLYHTNIIDTTYLRRVQVSQKDLDKYAVIEGDLLFTRSSLVAEGVGRANIVPKLEEQTMFESHVIRARIDKKKINPFFALGLFRSQFGNSEMMKRAKTSTMTTIGQDTLYEFPCPLPPLSLQEEFAGVVARVESLRGRMGESERQVEGLFESLLAQSFDGGR